MSCSRSKGTTESAPTAPLHSPIFREVAEESGIRFQWGHGGRSPLTILETAGGGCGFIDYNRDDRPDIVLVGSTVALFKNKGAGTFQDVSAGSGLDIQGSLMGCAGGDVNNDGFPDLFISGHGIARLYRNEGGSGRFRDVTETSGIPAQVGSDWFTSAGFCDLDSDGNLDLLVCRYLRFTKQDRQYCEYPSADGSSATLTACPPLYYQTQKLAAYRNTGDGAFVDISNRFPGGHGNGLALAFADFDADGKTDVYVANDAQPGDLYRNLGEMKFENVGTQSATAFNEDGREQAGMGADWGDYDGDGLLDLIVTTFQNEPRSLYRNEGRGMFSYASNRAGIGDQTRNRLAFGGGFIDFDNDSYLDLIFANGHVQDTIARIHPPATYSQTMQLFRNAGDGRFLQMENHAGPAFSKLIVGRGVAFADYDRDGKVDALIADSEGRPLLLHNEDPNSNHWLGLRLISHGRDAIGARVTVRTAKGMRVGELQTCRSYLATNDAVVHIGLGKEEEVKELTVRWPGGRITTTTRVPIDSYVTLNQERTR